MIMWRRNARGLPRHGRRRRCSMSGRLPATTMMTTSAPPPYSDNWSSNTRQRASSQGGVLRGSDLRANQGIRQSQRGLSTSARQVSEFRMGRTRYQARQNGHRQQPIDIAVQGTTVASGGRIMRTSLVRLVGARKVRWASTAALALVSVLAPGAIALGQTRDVVLEVEMSPGATKETNVGCGFGEIIRTLTLDWTSTSAASQSTIRVAISATRSICGTRSTNTSGTVQAWHRRTSSG